MKIGGKHKMNDIEEWLTPPPEEQVFLILQGKCPHNNGWRLDGHTSHEDAYKCVMCGEIEFY